MCFKIQQENETDHQHKALNLAKSFSYFPLKQFKNVSFLHNQMCIFTFVLSVCTQGVYMGFSVSNLNVVYYSQEGGQNCSLQVMIICSRL